MLLEDCKESRASVRTLEPSFPVFPEFRSASYGGRYELLCCKLVQEGLYDSAALVLSSQGDQATGFYSSLSEETSIEMTATRFAKRIAYVASLYEDSLHIANVPSLYEDSLE